jgi:flagellar basal-body rod protein FlgG
LRALSIAATGMSAQQLNVEVIANNIANINTTGFKRSRAEFTDLLYQMERTNGVPATAGGGSVPEGAQLGLGVRPAAIRNVHIQGPLSSTGNKLDTAINGEGWYMINGANGETLYTRDGAFNTNENGQIVTADGYEVQPPMTVPSNTTDIKINMAGEVYAQVAGQTQPTLMGQLNLATFANPAGLEALGGNLFRETVSSGSAVTGVAEQAGFGQIHQGYLEESNVDPVKEMTDLISAQRAYEINSKIIQAVDDMAGTVAKGLR